jgi:hypothetical protein
MTRIIGLDKTFIFQQNLGHFLCTYKRHDLVIPEVASFMEEASMHNEKALTGLILTNLKDSKYEYSRITPLVFLIGIPFEYKDLEEVKIEDLIEENGPKYDLVIANYVYTEREPSQYPVSLDGVEALLKIANLGSTVIINDSMLYWLKNQLSVDYRGIEKRWVTINAKFEDGTQTKFEASNFAKVVPLKKQYGNNLVLGRFENNKELIIFAEIVYGKGKIVIVNSYLARYLYTYDMGNGRFLKKIVEKLDAILNDVLPIRFFGYKYGKDMSLAIRIDDIFPMMHPAVICNLKNLDKIIIRYGMKATYALTPFGRDTWFAIEPFISKIVSKIAVCLSKIPLHARMPYVTYLVWALLWKTTLKAIMVSGLDMNSSLSNKTMGKDRATNKTWEVRVKSLSPRFTVYSTSVSGLPDAIKVQAGKNGLFKEHITVTYGQEFTFENFKLIWTNIDNSENPKKIYLNVGNRLEEQLDPTFLTYIRHMCDKHGFKIAVHGLRHWRTGLIEPFENEYYIRTSDGPTNQGIRSRVLQKEFMRAFNYLSKLFDCNLEKVIVVPWGMGYSTTPEFWKAAEELGLFVHLLKWKPEMVMYPYRKVPKLEASPIEGFISNRKVRKMFLSALAARGYFVALCHAQSTAHPKLDTLGKLHEKYRGRIWHTTLGEQSQYIYDRWKMLNPALNKFNADLKIIRTKYETILRYNTPQKHRNHVIRINKKLIGKIENISVNKGWKVIRTNANFVELEIEGAGSIEVRIAL